MSITVTYKCDFCKEVIESKFVVTIEVDQKSFPSSVRHEGHWDSCPKCYEKILMKIIGIRDEKD